MQFAFTGIVFMPLLLLSAETVASIYHLLVLYAPGQMITEILWAFQLSLYTTPSTIYMSIILNTLPQQLANKGNSGSNLPSNIVGKVLIFGYQTIVTTLAVVLFPLSAAARDNNNPSLGTTLFEAGATLLTIILVFYSFLLLVFIRRFNAILKKHMEVTMDPLSTQQGRRSAPHTHAPPPPKPLLRHLTPASSLCFSH